MGILSVAAWLEIAGAMLIAVGFELRMSAPPASPSPLPSILIVAGVFVFIYGIIKANLHPQWLQIGGVMLFIAGFIGKTINPSTSVEYEIANVFTAVGIVVFIRGIMKARAARALAEMSPETEEGPPPEA